MDMVFWILGGLLLLVVAFFTFGHPILSALSNWQSKRRSRTACPDCGLRCKGHEFTGRF